ncbi:hypothetical protein [Streptomyces sp. R41]|uniref:Uncharacterized protein n=1 Tax=Streptomyces sp. R41 TaxID=3238632 RepID=A0AB39RAG6_9ACTN
MTAAGRAEPEVADPGDVETPAVDALRRLLGTARATAGGGLA